MESEDAHTDEITEPDLWAASAARNLTLTARISTALFIGAGLAIVLGVVAAVASYSVYGGPNLGDVGDVVAASSFERGFAATQSSTLLLSSLLPAGVLAAAAVALRLQASRFEAEILGR